MSGAGFKTFAIGEVLTAANVNNYLMKQAVMVFATATARSTAITSPTEGMVTYLADNNRIEYYDGTAWQPLVDQDVIAAKGDLIVGTGDDTVARLAVGTNNHVLTADSATSTGLKWASVGPFGKVLQVVSTCKTDTFSTTSTSLTDITGLSLTITPSAATSQIMLWCSIGAIDATTAAVLSIAAERGGTYIGVGNAAGSRTRVGAFTITQDAHRTANLVWSFLDSPNTTNATTYQIDMRTSGGTAYINRSQIDGDAASTGRAVSTITAFEIGA